MAELDKAMLRIATETLPKAHLGEGLRLLSYVHLWMRCASHYTRHRCFFWFAEEHTASTMCRRFMDDAAHSARVERCVFRARMAYARYVDYIIKYRKETNDQEED